MESTSRTEQAAEILQLCLSGKDVPDALLCPLVEAASGGGPDALEASRALFASIVEPLADRFESKLCGVYSRLFARVVGRLSPEFDPAELVSRYERLRRVRRFDDRATAPDRVCVLSRVTLGADVAVTSIILDAAKKRFPKAEIHFVGGRKNWELFARDTRLLHWNVSYRRRGSLRDRLEAGLALRERLSQPGSLVIDPDSRLSQLGVLPVCPEENCCFFESRSFGEDGGETLSALTKRWAAETFGVVDALPYVAPEPPAVPIGGGGITVSFGVGENQEKRVAGSFESEILRRLRDTKLPILVDKGAGGEEAERVDRAIAASGAKPGEIETWSGAFAPFAAQIARSRLYVGYDSAGQHAAAGAKTPLVSVFAGFPSERFYQRWHPAGSGAIEVVRVRKSVEETIEAAHAAVNRLLAER